MVKFNLKNFNRKVVRAWRQAAEVYAQQCQTELSSSKWDWDGDTVRSDGTVVGSPRDVVDTEDLIDSQQRVKVQEKPGEIIASIEWDSDHATVVHEGRTDTDEYDGRPWTHTALQAVDMAQTFGEKLRRLL